MNIALVEQQTKALVESGFRLFQIHRFAESDNAHIARLLQWADFPDCSTVADMGCGVGEVAGVMGRLRDDLDFVLVNISGLQLEYAHGTKKIQCDFHSVPLATGSLDAVMFCFSIGHGEPLAALNEAHRLLKPDGVLFIYDMVRVSGDNSSMEEVEYKVNSRAALEADAVGFTLDFYMEPSDRGGFGESLLGADYARIFGGTIPAIWRFIKC